ncbi:MAG: aminotransferase class V-fold PLP-dependent enzyme [Ruminococcus sp.]|nr:aminotransferase class V-fold PLP-dependent enzyme [Ruminococcus sp.]
MKKFKRIVSVLLGVVLCCSSFAVSAQAKTAKQYVNSISVKSKAAITIPATKKTVTKSYKVTVKVTGNASKKFTAKSSKPSVATVKVSGSYIKVTAKKAGTAKITVTTKAKNAKNKKLSKKLTIAVSAKTAAKYVQSVSVKSKDTITIPADKKTVTKSYKVTVKVKGNASTKFTAKSGKTSVATVKVSGSYIKVTAQKAGTAKITVTTKAKNAKNKTLSKNLTITVNKKTATKPDPEPKEPASIPDYNQEIELRYNPLVGDIASSYGIQFVSDLVADADPEGTYYAEVADTSIATTMQKNAVIGYVSEGTTTADIYEELNGVTRKLGTITVNVIKLTLAEAMDNALIDYDDNELYDLWLKLNFGKISYDMGATLKRAFVNNEELGTTLTEDDFTISFKSDDDKVATVTEDGVITGVKNGETYVVAHIVYSDGSESDVNDKVKVTGAAIETVDGYTIDNIRDYIVGLDTPVELADGTMKPLTNFDNAATTPALKVVQDAINEELEMYGSIGRGFSQKSNHSTDVYNSVRDKVLDFFTADPELYTCLYVNSTTDGLNKLASALIEDENDIVLTTRIEHHSNDLSWRERCKVIYAEVDEQGRVIYDDIEKLLKENKVKIVSISAASNVTGYVNDVHRVAKMAHKYGAKIVVDGAQIVAHRKFYMMGDLNDPDDDIDFIAFSAHKMYSPYGGGAVVGLTEELNEHMPTFYGGGTIKVVGDNWQFYKDAPEAYEAGSPNYPGVVGLGKAIDALSTIGLDKIEAHEKVLNRKIIDGLKKLDNVILYGDTENIDDRVGVVTFNFSDINTYFISQKLSEIGGVATRRGAFCAHPYVWRLMGISDETAKSFASCVDINTAGMVRVSFGIYNTEAEVDEFLNIMPQVMKEAKVLQEANALVVPEY